MATALSPICVTVKYSPGWACIFMTSSARGSPSSIICRSRRRREAASEISATEQAATAAAPQAPVPADTEAVPDTARSARAMGRLLDSAAGREAVQSAARQGLVRPQIPAQREDPLASGMRQAAQGDCMKGEFKGGGMGLLSLPMLAAAALKGECSR